MSGGTGAVFSSSLDYTDPNLILLTSPQGWGGDVVPGGQLGYDNRPEIDDELKQISLSMERELSGSISGMEFGVNLATREKTKGNNEFFLGLASGATEAPLQNVTGITDLSFLGLPSMISYDPAGAHRHAESTRDRRIRTPTSRSRDGPSKKTRTSPISMFGLDTEVGRFPLTGNFGLQYMDVDQKFERRRGIRNRWARVGLGR